MIQTRVTGGFAALLSLALAVSPAAANRKTHHAAHRHATRRQAASNQVAPLTPAAHAPVADASAAPVPNETVTAPIDNSDQTTSLAPAVMQIHYPPQGDGYVSGSSAQAMDDREAAKVTGLQAHIPLGQ
jgi:hypothetical protein